MKKKKIRRRKRAIDERKHLLFSLIKHVLYKRIQKNDLRFFSKFFRIFRIKTNFYETNLTILLKCKEYNFIFYESRNYVTYVIRR